MTAARAARERRTASGAGVAALVSALFLVAPAAAGEADVEKVTTENGGTYRFAVTVRVR